MRDKPHFKTPKLDWPGGVVPEWARPQGNANKRRRGNKAKGAGAGGGGAKRERLQKVMAQSGYGSRRNIEILIAQGHVTVNGQAAKLGDSVGPGDKVKLDGNLVRLRFGEPLPRVLVYHKPEGEIVTRDDPEGRATVFEKLPKVNGGRWVSVGRLDLNTGGLLIFTTSGELANRLTHPRFEVEREYAVRLLGELDEEKKQKLLDGVDIEGEACKFDAIEDRGGEGANHWYHVVLREGKNREVRRMCEAVGLTVSRLMRVRFGEVTLPSFLKRAQMKELGEEEVQTLLAFAGMNEPEAGEEKPEHAEDEHDNIGNRAPAASRKERHAHEIDESRDNIGNRYDPRFHKAEEPIIDDDVGNRIDHSRQVHAHASHGGQPRGHGKRGGGGVAHGMADGNRALGEPHMVDGNRADAPMTHANRPPKQHGQQRPQGGKPFFNKKKRGGGAQAQGGGTPGQGQPHGHRKQRGPKPVQVAGATEGNAAPPAQGTPQPHGNKPGRHRRHKNRNRNRGADGAPQPVNNTNREPV
ncbi:MAG TPA: pseudouridine synthase [Usitatibacter sp.]|jgi:23S rRNA pseudouridine2605 synthase|nr:pseudouridine synthase [Usitatibacter sp.]